VRDKHFKFHKVVYRDIIQVRWKMFTSFYSKIYSGNCVHILSELPELCRRYYTKTFWSLFSSHTVEWLIDKPIKK